MTVVLNIVDSLLFCQRRASGPAPMTERVRKQSVYYRSQGAWREEADANRS